VLVRFAPRTVQALGPFMLATTEDTLLLVLETLSVCVEIDGGSWLTPALARDVTAAALEVWGKTNKGQYSRRVDTLINLTHILDPMFTSVLADVLQYLAASRNPGVYETVVQAALPPLSSALAGASDEQSWIAETAIELVAGVVSAAPEGRLGDGFFAALAPTLFAVLKRTEDKDTLQVCIPLPSWGCTTNMCCRTASCA
jgi:hypothetical protein